VFYGDREQALSPALGEKTSRLAGSTMPACSVDSSQPESYTQQTVNHSEADS
jgi:hypothetical protein